MIAFSTYYSLILDPYITSCGVLYVAVTTFIYIVRERERERCLSKVVVRRKEKRRRKEEHHNLVHSFFSWASKSCVKVQGCLKYDDG